jgi:hypothetical protein
MVEQQAPLEALELDRRRAPGVVRVLIHFLDEVDQRIRIESARDNAQQKPIGRQIIHNRPRLRRQSCQNRMPGGTGISVFAVGKITLPPVHDRVPEGGGRIIGFLYD